MGCRGEMWGGGVGGAGGRLQYRSVFLLSSIIIWMKGNGKLATVLGLHEDDLDVTLTRFSVP